MSALFVGLVCVTGGVILVCVMGLIIVQCMFNPLMKLKELTIVLFIVGVVLWQLGMVLMSAGADAMVSGY